MKFGYGSTPTPSNFMNDPSPKHRIFRGVISEPGDRPAEASYSDRIRPPVVDARVFSEDATLGLALICLLIQPDRSVMNES
eukprot:2054679-Prymnesium_polylepis.3